MSNDAQCAAPLEGTRIIEFAGIGPGPFACMMLADMGAEIIRIDRPVSDANSESNNAQDFMLRGRKSVALDLKKPAAIEIALTLIEQADGVVEGYRPGVMERLGLGPDICLNKNPKLVYGRMTGWGQHGPLAKAAGHDLNYIALSGALWASGHKDQTPTFSMNLLGDFGGGAMYLAYGMVCGLLKAHSTGYGDVVDASIVDGTSNLMTFIHARRAMGEWQDERESNLLDGGAPWYAVYQCADDHWVTIAALEPQFWTCLLEQLQLKDEILVNRDDRSNWPAIRDRLASLFKSESRQYWVDL
ncbi:MAG: CoA transferase, partial [Gammaproteobacteria bacterium]|nr:CoA transferase [Gammaproteobacteria bacterium]